MWIFIRAGSVEAQQTATDFFRISQKSFAYKDYDNAIFFANKAIALNPYYGAAFWNRALAYDCKGLYEKSASDYKTAIKLYENNPDQAILYKNLGVVFISMKLFDSAVVNFNMAIALNPDYGLAWWNRGIAFDGMKKNDSAILNYTHAIADMTKAEDISQLLLLRGIDYSALGNKEKSDSDFIKVLAMNNEPGYYSAYSHYLLGDVRAAKADLDKFLAKGKKKPADMKNTYFSIASVNAIMKDEKEALKYLELALKNGYNDYQYINRDSDFENIRNQPDFILLIRKYNK